MKTKRRLKILLCLAVIICTMITSIAANYDGEVNAADDGYIAFTENNIKTTDMRKKSKLDETKFSEYMKRFPSLYGIEDTLLEIQDEYSVNALLILAIIRLESGNGKSDIARSRNNLGGLIGYENSVRTYKSFDTQSDCVIYMARLLSTYYLTEGGKYFNGYTLTDIAKSYSTSPDVWSELVKDMINEIQEGIDNIQDDDKEKEKEKEVEVFENVEEPKNTENTETIEDVEDDDNYGWDAVVRAGLFSALTIFCI